MSHRNMMLQIIFNIIITLILFLCPSLYATEIIRFEKGIEGLPKQIEGNMIRDKEGFLWFCYYGGVGRYDGYEVKYFETGPGSVSGAAAMSLTIDNDGIIWILTKDNGLNKYDKMTDSFTYFKHDPLNTNSIASNSSDNFCPQRLFVDQKGRLLIGTNAGFDIYDKTTGVFTHHKHNPDNLNSLSSNNVTAVIEGKNGVLWIGTSGGGLNKYDPENGQWTRYQYDSENNQSISSNIIWSLLEDRNGILWVGTWDQGLNKFNKETGTFIRYKHDPENPNSIAENKITYLYEDSSGRIWLTHRGSKRAGLEMLDLENDRFIKYGFDPKDPFSVSSNSVSTIFEDKTSGILWVLNTYHGVFDKYDKNTQKFSLYQHDPDISDSIFSSQVAIMHEDRKGRFWITVKGSLELLNRASNKFIHYPYKKYDPSIGTVIIAINEDDNGVFWMLDFGKLGSLIKFDIENMKPIKHFRHDPNNPESLMVNTMPGPAMIEDKDDSNILWIGLSSGLEKFNKRTETFTHFIHDPNDTNSISRGTVWSLWDDGKGALWISTFGGLNKLDKLTGKSIRYNHDPENPHSIGFNKNSGVFEDSIGNLWITGLTDGFDKFDRKTGRFKHFNKRTGFPATGVTKSIQEDEQENLWIGTTDAGLIKFDIQTESVKKIYTTGNGLHGNYLWRSYKTKDGTLWFSGPAGLSSFNPEEITDNTNIPSIVLTAIKQGGENLDIGMAAEKIKSVNLSWDSNYFEFQFAALNYTKPEKNKYAYMLQGIDKDWFYSDNKPFGRYTNLPGGTYILKMKGSNNDGIWNEKGTSIKIIVQSPFWETKWFYFLSASVLITIFCFMLISARNLKREVFERKRIEKSLKKSEEKYREIIEGTQDLITRTDEYGNFTFINHVAEKILGLSPEECIGRSAFDFIHPDDREMTIEWFNEGVAKKKIEMKIENRLVNVRTGELCTMLWSTSFHFDESDLLTGVGGIARDVTERKRAEIALRESEERLNAILESSPDPVVVYDTKGTPHYLNPSFTNSFGWNLAELKGKRIPFVPEDQKTISASKVDELYRFSRPVTFFSRRLTKHGNILDVIISAAIIKDSEENPAGMVVNLTDITKQKMLETQLQQAQKMESVGRLAGGVAHDFNNMLGVILGHVEFAFENADENHELYDDLKEIQKAAQRSADLTKQLLAFARKQTISPKQLNLNETVESMLNMLRRLIGEDIDLVWQPSTHLWPVKMDPSQIDQILANLCINARDAIAGVGKLTIETGKKSFDEEYCKQHSGFIPGDFVMLAVSDNGCGMDKDTLDNIFEPFFTTKEVGKGTGLGLATVYGIVKQNNGFINVYTEPDQGSTFKIYLPRLVTDEVTDKAVPEKKAAVGGTETILLVEDEPSILRMTRMMLERNGYSVLSAATPAEAIEKAKNHSGAIDLLMSDVVMPEMNGRDLAGKITDLYPDIGLLFMSGYTSNVIAHQGVLDDGVAFIQKPFSLADMTEKVRNILDSASVKD